MIGTILDKVLERTREILTKCECSRSCKNCLDNYYNQWNHYLFDRTLGLQLLDYAELKKYPSKYDEMEKNVLLYPLLKLIEEDGSRKIPETLSFEFVPALLKKENSDPQKLYFNPYDLTDWLPNAFMTFRDYLV